MTEGTDESEDIAIARALLGESSNSMPIHDVLDQLAQGGSIYKVWIEEDDLVPTMNPELEIDDRRHLLANTKSRGLLEEGAGKWRAVW